MELERKELLGFGIEVGPQSDEGDRLRPFTAGQM